MSYSLTISLHSSNVRFSCDLFKPLKYFEYFSDGNNKPEIKNNNNKLSWNIKNSFLFVMFLIVGLICLFPNLAVRAI